MNKKFTMDNSVIVPAPQGVFSNIKGQGFCFVCGIALSSPQVKQDHVKGKRHKYKLGTCNTGNSAEGCRLQDIMGCHICESIFCSSVEEHLDSDLHRRSLVKNESKTVAGVDQSLTMANTAAGVDQSLTMAKTVAGVAQSLTMAKTVAGVDQSLTMAKTTAGVNQSLTMAKTTAGVNQSLTMAKTAGVNQSLTMAKTAGVDQSLTMAKTAAGVDQSLTMAKTVAGVDQSLTMAKTAAGVNQSLTMAKTVAGVDQSLTMAKTAAGVDQSLTMAKTVAGVDQSLTMAKTAAGVNQSLTMAKTAAGVDQSLTMAKTAGVDQSLTMAKTVAGVDQSLTMAKTAGVDQSLTMAKTAGVDQSLTMAKTAGVDQSLTMAKTAGVDQSLTMAKTAGVDQSLTMAKTVTGAGTLIQPSVASLYPFSSNHQVHKPDPPHKIERLKMSSLMNIFPGIGTTPAIHGEGQVPSIQSHVQIVKGDRVLNDLDGKNSESSNTGITGLNIPLSDDGEEEQVPETMSFEPGTYPRSCILCFTNFTAQINAGQHFASKNHKMKARIAKEVKSGKLPMDIETGALKMEFDGHVWYICNLCMCHMNSKGTYRQHIQSPSHKEAAERHVIMKSKEITSDTNPDKSSVTKTGATGLGGTESGSSTQRKWSDSSIQNREEESQSSHSKVIAPNSGSVNGDRASNFSGAAVTKRSKQSQRGEAATSLSPQDSEPATAMTSQTGNCTRMNNSGGAAHNHPEQGAAGGSSPDPTPEMTACQRPQNAARNRRSQSGATNMVTHERSPSTALSRNPTGPRLRLGGDYELDDSDDDLRTLPRLSSAAGYCDKAGRSLEETSGDCDMFAGFEESSLLQTATDTSTVSDNDKADSDYEESEPFETASDQSTSSDNETSADGEVDSSGMMRGMKTADATNLVEGYQGGTHSPLNGFKFPCHLCKKGMNTKKDFEFHEKSYGHMTKLATVPAPDKRGEPLVKCQDADRTMKMSQAPGQVTEPRSYQMHLLCKTMDSDSSVVFLPTGTGKTLIAMMAIRQMLMLNKTRPVLFLTDKVLLVMQQGDNIKKELGDITFLRPHLTEEGRLEERHLRVAKLCGGLSLSDALPLWKYDVIVITAVFCQKLLDKKVLRWTNFSMVILDEAHHCIKHHPYKVLMDSHHLPVNSSCRPKVLGLTASPAGKTTQEATLHMMKKLLSNLGGATMVAVDETSQETAEQEAIQGLNDFTSNARLVMEHIHLTDIENEFQTKVGIYFDAAFKKLFEHSNLKKIFSSRELRNTRPDGPEQISKLLRLAQSDGVQPEQPNHCDQFYVILKHVKAVGQALLSSEDGIAFVLEDLEHIFDVNQNPHFSQLIRMGLECEDIANYVKNLNDSGKFHIIEKGSESPEEAVIHMSAFQKLLEALANPVYISWENPSSMVLVLVREIEMARKFKKYLKRASLVRQHDIGVKLLVGHGAKSGEGSGMNLRKQDQTLRQIRSAQCHQTIIVATSVAEEGIDIPECQLVICVNIPTTAKAMVQMRGRARKKNSTFVVLCNNHKEVRKMEELQQEEKNMKWAVNQLLHPKSV